MNVTYDINALPVLEWQDEGQSGGYVSVAFKTNRRCRIAMDTSGGCEFVHEASDYNKAARPLLAASLVGGWLGRKAAETFIKAKGLGLTEIREAAPWEALQGFTLTDEGQYFGRRTIGGDPLKVPDIVVIADFGPDHGQFVVAHGTLLPNVAAELHRRLTREFIVQRPRQLKRLAVSLRQTKLAADKTKII